MITILDEGSCALWTAAHYSISAKKLIGGVLDDVVEYHGRPAYIRCDDNGPELISHQLKQGAVERVIALRFIQPGRPSQNGLIERLDKALRRECLNLTWYRSMD